MCIRNRSIHAFKLGTKYVTGGTRVAKKLAWAKIDPWKTKGLVKNYRGPKVTHGRPKGSQKLPWAKNDPWYLARSRPKYHGQTRLRHQKRAKPLKEDQKLPWAKIDPWSKKLGGRKIGGNTYNGC